MITIPREMPIEERKEYFRTYDWFVKHFPQASVDRELMKMDVSSVVQEYASPLEDYEGLRLNPRNSYGKACKFLGEAARHHRFHKGGWYRDKIVRCKVWMVPYQYQGLSHAKMLKALLTEQAPWLSEFHLDCYEIRTGENSYNEFYVRLSEETGWHNQSLYVPYDAFFNNDADAVIERNETYLKGYTHSDEAWKDISTDPVTVKFLKYLRG